MNEQELMPTLGHLLEERNKTTEKYSDRTVGFSWDSKLCPPAQEA
jgi:hypothetical protein